MGIYQLAYISIISAVFSDKDLLKIMSASHRFNPSHNITGALMYRKGVFLQLLEGEMTIIENLFQKIKDDPRHENITLLFAQTSEKSVFPHWVVGYREPGDTDIAKIDEILHWKTRVKGTFLSAQEIFHLFEIFKRSASK